MAEETIHYYKKTVPYLVGGRRFPNDPVGFVITDAQPWVEVKESELRNFKIANKRAFLEGLIEEIPEPSIDWETDNALSDEQIDQIFKDGIAKLRKKLPTITSISTAARMLDRAKTQRRSEAMIDALEDRVAELQGEELELERIERVLDRDA